MSKSGIYAHFGSKQDLQLATVDEAGRIFQSEVIEPALGAPPGLGQLVAVCDAFFDYLARRTFPGGCFFAGAVLEMGYAPGTRQGADRRVPRRVHRPDPPIRRHRARTARAPRRREPRRSSRSSSAASSSPPTPTSSSAKTWLRSTWRSRSFAAASESHRRRTASDARRQLSAFSEPGPRAPRPALTSTTSLGRDRGRRTASDVERTVTGVPCVYGHVDITARSFVL